MKSGSRTENSKQAGLQTPLLLDLWIHVIVLTGGRRYALSGKLTEKQVVKIWQNALSSGAELVTDDGQKVSIIYPGRLNDDRGADFRDAVIATGRGLRKGDIEVHKKSSGWLAHRHHHDSAYDRVVLHVVMNKDAESATRLHSGKRVPLLVLDRLPGISHKQTSLLSPAAATPCIKAPDSSAAGIIAEFLDTAGEERYLARADRFQADMERMEAGQVLYRGIMGALGYSKNTLPFLELARRLPLHALEPISRDKSPYEERLARLQSLLLGTAGLLPSQRPENRGEPPDEWLAELEKLWHSSHKAAPMSPGAWRLFKVRPNNSPYRRMAAMSHLLLHYRETGVLTGLLEAVKEAPAVRGHHQLEAGLIIAGSNSEKSQLLGRRRAAEIAVNVILPFTLAWSRLASQTELRNKALGLYHAYPGMAANAVEKHMSRQLGTNGKLVNSARRQQGLIYIYKTLCTRGGCSRCPLNQFQAGRHIQI